MRTTAFAAPHLVPVCGAEEPDRCEPERARPPADSMPVLPSRRACATAAMALPPGVALPARSLHIEAGSWCCVGSNGTTPTKPRYRYTCLFTCLFTLPTCLLSQSNLFASTQSAWLDGKKSIWEAGDRPRSGGGMAGPYSAGTVPNFPGLHMNRKLTSHLFALIVLCCISRLLMWPCATW